MQCLYTTERFAMNAASQSDHDLIKLARDLQDNARDLHNEGDPHERAIAALYAMQCLFELLDRQQARRYRLKPNVDTDCLRHVLRQGDVRGLGSAFEWDLEAHGSDYWYARYEGDVALSDADKAFLERLLVEAESGQ